MFLIFSFNPRVYCQSNDLTQIFNLFDRGEIDNVKTLIDKINEKQIPLITSNDSLNFNLYRLIKYSLTELNPEYKEAIEWLKSKNAVVILPYFINDFISKSIKNTEKSSEYEKLLDLAIQVELEDKNQSVLLSKSNLFFSYRLLEIILRNQKRNDDLIETLFKRIDLYESNKQSLNYLNENQILYMYSSVANSEILEIKIRQDYYKKVFQKLSIIDNNYQKDYEYELSSYRHFIEKNNLGKDMILLPNNYLNEEYNPFLYHLNILYADNENSNSINELKGLINGIGSYNKNYILNYLEIICRYLSIELLHNKDDALSKNNKTQIENHNLLDFFKMCNDYFRNESDQEIRLLVLNNLLNFKNLDDNTLFLNEKTRLLEELIDTDVEILYYEWNFLIEQKLYAGANKNQLEELFEKVINEKITIYYQKVSFIEGIYDLTIRFNSLFGKNDLNNIRDYYSKYLSESITTDDFLFRVKLANNEDSINKLNYFISQNILKNPINDELKNLKFNLLIKINALEKSTETALEAFNYFIKEINSINNIFNNITVLDLLVTYNLKDPNNFIINNVLEYYIELKEESSQILSALLDLNLAFYYKKINRKYEALNYFTRIRTYDVYYDEGDKNLFDFNYGLNYFKILDQLISLNLELKQNEDAKDYINEFESYVNTIDNRFKTLENVIIKQIDINEFSKKKNILHWYKYWFYSNTNEFEKANQSLSRFDIKIHPELKFTFQRFQVLIDYDLNKISRETLREKLHEVYINNKVPFDSLYYTYVLLEDGEIKSGNYSLLIKTKIESIEKNFSNTSFNDQSFSTVVNNLISIGREIKEVEYYLSLDYNKDPELVEKHLDLILKTKSIDLQNRFLGEVEESKRDEFFEVLREFSFASSADYRKNQLKRDLIEQNLKGSFEDSYFGINQVKEKLGINEVLLIVSKIEFQGGNNDLYMGYLIQKNKIELIEFENIDFLKVYKYWLSKIEKDEVENVTYRYIAKPVIDKLSDQVNTINIIAEGIFKNINFETILDLSEETLDKRFSFNNYNGLNNIFNSSDNIEIKDAMLFGNPFYDSSGKNSLDFELEQLPYTQKEINQINNILIQNGIKTIKLDSLNAKEESFYSYKKKDLIHIATHGFSTKSSNEKIKYSFGFYGAGISNSTEKSINKNDGIIYSEEIETTNFTDTNLVVLSACESALGETNLVGGFNLSNSFHKAGVNNVISTLWEIDDEKTMQFMNIFYKKLMILKDPKESLISAKEDFKKVHPQRKYWGAFIHSKL